MLLAIIFFTSLSLARDLLQKKLTLVRTIRKNKPELPPKFTLAKGREVTSTVFGFQSDAMIASYCLKKGCVVNMLSTMHALPDISSTSCEKKPEVILYYNSTKSGVDILDRMVRTYTSTRMTRRWPVALFYNMLDVSAVNVYVVWHQLQGGNSSCFSKKKRRKFLIQLAKGLAGMLPTYINHAALPQNKRKGAKTEDQQPKPNKARCHLCDRSKDRKCKQICIACKKNVCQEHSEIICIQCRRA